MFSRNPTHTHTHSSYTVKVWGGDTVQDKSKCEIFAGGDDESRQAPYCDTWELLCKVLSLQWTRYFINFHGDCSLRTLFSLVKRMGKQEKDFISFNLKIYFFVSCLGGFFDHWCRLRHKKIWHAARKWKLWLKCNFRLFNLTVVATDSKIKILRKNL